VPTTVRGAICAKVGTLHGAYPWCTNYYSQQVLKKFPFLDDFQAHWPVDDVLREYFKGRASYHKDRNSGALARRQAAQKPARGTETDNESDQDIANGSDNDAASDNDRQGRFGWDNEGDERDADEVQMSDDKEEEERDIQAELVSTLHCCHYHRRLLFVLLLYICWLKNSFFFRQLGRRNLSMGKQKNRQR